MTEQKTIFYFDVFTNIQQHAFMAVRASTLQSAKNCVERLPSIVTATHVEDAQMEAAEKARLTEAYDSPEEGEFPYVGYKPYWTLRSLRLHTQTDLGTTIVSIDSDVGGSIQRDCTATLPLVWCQSIHCNSHQHRPKQNKRQTVSRGSPASAGDCVAGGKFVGTPAVIPSTFGEPVNFKAVGFDGTDTATAQGAPTCFENS
jgi:hypothetical protein